MAEPLPSTTRPEDAEPGPALDVIGPARTAPARIAWWLIVPFALAPIVLAVLQLGRWHPDEVYQFLEPAWFRVHGYGVRSWEWHVGLRNWSVPLVFAFFLQIAQSLGIDHPRAYRALVALPQLVLHAAMLVAAYHYVERRLTSQGRAATWLGLALVAAFAPVLYLAGRTMGESLSAAFLVLACDALDRDDRPARQGALGGLFLGLAVVVRYGSAAFAVSMLVWLVLRRRWPALAAACTAGAVVAAGLAALDWATWGQPLHSLLKYLEFNVLTDRSAQRFGAAPVWSYLPLLAVWFPAWAGVGIPAAWYRERFVPLGAFASAAYLVAISLTPHKEDRFVYPALVLFALAGAPGVVWLIWRIRAVSWRALAAAAALAAGSIAWAVMPDVRGDQFRAQVKATRDPAATGLLIVNEGLWGSGGFFYIGRNLPWYNCDFPEHALQIVRANPRVNRVITFEGRAIPELQSVGFRIVDRVGRETILAR
jgi:phosphatidylinositol glycan class B